MFSSVGIMRYYQSWAVLEIDQQLADYYRSLLPKHIEHNRPRYPAHITIVREGKDNPIKHYWNKRQGKQIEFFYEPIIYESKSYFWLNAFSKELEEIRIELGLPLNSWDFPAKGFDKIFHFTVANRKL